MAPHTRELHPLPGGLTEVSDLVNVKRGEPVAPPTPGTP